VSSGSEQANQIGGHLTTLDEGLKQYATARQVEYIDAVNEHGSNRRAAEHMGIHATAIDRGIKAVLKKAALQGYSPDYDMDMLETNVRLAKQKQGLMDVQRVERKSFREHARVENAIEALDRELVDIFKNYQFKAPNAAIKSRNSKACAVLHISDNHLNEMVDLPHNKFDWHIASKRLKKLADKAIMLCKAYNIENIVVCFTGDLINSDRRLDELLTNAGNRASACALATILYGQMLHHLSCELNVSCASISGNESRIQKDVGWAREVSSDNYDFLIYNMLKMLHGNYINFSESNQPNEQVINVAGQNILLIHGHGTKGTGQANIQSIKGRYLARGVVVDMVISGHIHEAYISDAYARSASLVGSNNYSEDALNLAGRASQNVYIIHQGGGFDGIKVDLQNTDGVTGYDIEDHLISYNTKSAIKAHKGEVIFSVVI
jgi:predicted phosphodiesterase